MAGFGKRLLFEPMRSIASDDITANYSIAATLQDASGNIALAHPARFIMVDNVTDKGMLFSFDGVNDHFMVYAMSSKVLDIGSNKEENGSFFLGKGEVLYIKYIADPTNGTKVYFSVAYGKGD